MANRSTRARNRAIRKAGEHFHGKPCKTNAADTGATRTNFPDIERHSFVEQRETCLKAKGLLK
jgi:hypothetical protein